MAIVLTNAFCDFKKLHKREQMKDYKEGESQYVSPSNLKSMRLESVGDNPLRLAEQL